MPIELSDLSFSYGERLVLDRLSCTFPEGTTSALVGPSGSGKSTVIALIIGHLLPASGSISYPPELLLDERIDSRRIAWVSQTADLFTRRSAIDNVLLPLRVAGVDPVEAFARATEALRRTGLATRQHDEPARLSGGQRQRVAVARALAARTPLVIADEPTVALDKDNRDRLVDDLTIAADAGAIVILATHDKAVWARCDQRVML